MRRPGGPVSFSLRLYRWLAGAFPYEFKNAYGEELLDVSEEAIEGIWRRDGISGLLRLLLDLTVRVPAEHLAEIWRDAQYGLRALAASKGFTTVALLSLGLGICVATCAYSEMNGLMRDLPRVGEPSRLAALQMPVSYPDYKRFRALGIWSSSFVYVAAVPFEVAVGGRNAERSWGNW